MKNILAAIAVFIAFNLLPLMVKWEWEYVFGFKCSEADMAGIFVGSFMASLLLPALIICEKPFDND